TGASITGATGPTGPTGETGDPGQAGGAVLSAFWTYNATTTLPPATGQLRSNHATTPTTLWIHETDTDGFSRILGLSSIATGNRIFLRAANGTQQNLTISGTPMDSGVYWTIPVTVNDGSITKGA